MTRVKEVQHEISVMREKVTEEATFVFGSGTYAEVPKEKIKRPTKELHSIIVTSEAEIDNSQEVIDKTRVAVNTKQSGIRVDRIRKARDEKVIVSCEKRVDLKRVLEHIKGSKARTHTAKNKDTQVFLKDVLTFNSDEDLDGPKN